MGRTRTKTGVLYRRKLMSGQKNVTVKIGVSRVEKLNEGYTRMGMETGSRAFVACATFGHGGYVKLSKNFEPTKMHGMCAYGKNPRKAMAGAMRKAAKHIAGRGGAFARYRR